MTKIYLIESNDLVSREKDLTIAKYLQKMNISLDSVFYNNGKNDKTTATTLSTILCKSSSSSLIEDNKLNTIAIPTPGLNKNILIVAETPFLQKIIYLLFENETINIKRNSIICIEHSEDKNWELEFIINYDRLKFIQNKDKKALDLNEAITNKYKDMELDFNSILDKSNDYFYIKDTDYKFRTVNDNFAKLTGHQHWSEIVGKTDFDIFPKSTAQMYRNDDESVIQLGQPVLDRLESYPMLDGTEGWVKTSKLPIFDENGNVIRMFGFSADVTSLIRAENKLKQLNETLEDEVKLATMNLERAQELSKIGSCRFDIKENIFKCSNQFYTILGIDKSQNKITSLNDLSRILHGSISNNIIKDIYKNNEPYKKTYKINTDAGIKYIEERYETTFDDNGNPLVSNDTIQDITEEVLQNQIFLQQSRMAQMGELLSIIAHQWKQPLSAISVTSANLELKIDMGKFDLDTKEGQEEQNKYFINQFRKINGFVENLSTTMDDFRNFYRPDKKLSKVKLDAVISKAMTIIKASLVNDNIEIIQEYLSDEYIEMFDIEVMQVVLNIIKNAQDQFKEKDIKNKYIKIKTKDKTISICDNAGGIPIDKIENIFEPYFSTKDESTGTGLGLSMCKTIIEEHHDGKLSAENVDDGACFNIEFGTISEEQKI